MTKTISGDILSFDMLFYVEKEPGMNPLYFWIRPFGMEAGIQSYRTPSIMVCIYQSYIRGKFMNGIQYLIRFLEGKQTKVVFGYPGSAVLPIS
ncbi:MAG TPA: hypothetical protein DCY75_08815, partial [Clostridiales bacterium]|nr:hypothetical protein [Clostridiales bacterium]